MTEKGRRILGVGPTVASLEVAVAGEPTNPLPCL